MSLEVFFCANGGQVPLERVAGARCPAGVEKPDQGLPRRRVIEPGRIARRRQLSCGALDDSVKERVAGGEMGVDRLSADPGRPSDVLDARLWLRAERLGCRLQDRGEVLLGVGSPPPSPDLGLGWRARPQ